MIVDVELSVQSKCLEVVGSAIFSNVVTYSRSSSDHHRMAWSLLDSIADASSADLWFVGYCLSFSLCTVVTIIIIIIILL